MVQVGLVVLVVQTLITLQGWRTFYLCSTFYGDLLVTTISAYKLTKVVRYSAPTEKQRIQWMTKVSRSIDLVDYLAIVTSVKARI